MPPVYELPTHLQVEDVLIAGLTARQLVRLMIGASLGYGVWDQAGWLPQDVRLAVAMVPAVIGVLFALAATGRPPAGPVAARWHPLCPPAAASGLATWRRAPTPATA